MRWISVVTAAFVLSSCTQQPSNGGPVAATADIDDCDRLAASPFDPHSTVDGISLEKIDTAHAIPACATAVRTNPQNPRFLFEYGRALDAAKRYQEAMQWYRKSSERGESRALCGLATLYLNGHGVTQDYAETIKWYREAAERESACGQNGLGLLYAKGQGVGQDYAEAMKWFRKAADQGDVVGQSNVGAMYGSGHGVAQNYGEALRQYRIAAGKGYALAQRNLGASYYLGQGVPQDYAEAFNWYQLAAKQGDADAQNIIGSMYQKGQGLSQDDAEAMKWYRLSAGQGVALAQGNVAAMYVNGRGVAKNYPEAIKLYLAAANEGDSASQLGLGAMYYLGEGTKTDYSEAARWFRKSAEQGNADAQTYLGVMYEEGKGVPQDVAEAMKWYASAAKLGNQGAQLKVLELSASRDSGNGTPPMPDAEKQLISNVQAPTRPDAQGVDHGRPAPTSSESKKSFVHCVVADDSTPDNPASIPQDIRSCEAAVKATSLSEESDKIDHVEMRIHSGVFGYDLYIHYKKEGFSGIWAGSEVGRAYGDDYHLASEFVRQLVKSGRNPSAEPNQKFVAACGEEDGFTTITGRPGIKLLGCAQYDPYSDAVDPDFRRPVGQ